MISRDLVQLNAAEEDFAIFHCPENMLACGLTINRSMTSCFLSLESPAGSAILDLRFPEHQLPWVCVVIPLLETIGGGDITVRVIEFDDTCPASRGVPDTIPNSPLRNTAEIGHMLLLKSDLAKAYVYAPNAENRRHLAIEALPEASSVLLAAECVANGVADGSSELGFGSRGLASLALQHFSSREAPSCVDQEEARALLLSGRPEMALAALERSSSKEDLVTQDKIRKLRAFLSRP